MKTHKFKALRGFIAELERKAKQPDSPSDARDLNQGRDVLKPSMHEPMSYGPQGDIMLGLPGRRRLIGTIEDGDACERIVTLWNTDPAATIEALRGALASCCAYITEQHSIDAQKPDNAVNTEWAETLLTNARVALALCARDGKSGVS